jgi:hypothetical protein
MEPTTEGAPVRSLTPKANEALDEVFRYHPPSGNQAARYHVLREAARAFASDVIRWCPAGPDRTAALRLIREALMTANASIALEGRDALQVLGAVQAIELDAVAPDTGQ